MSKLATKGNIAIFEYPNCDEPNFDLDDSGVLFITGYKMPFMGDFVRCAKRFETKLENYQIIGRLEYADTVTNTDLKKIAAEAEIDFNNCVVMIRKTQ